MRDLKNRFKNREIDYSKLLNYGFIKANNNYHYEKSICNEHFNVIVDISKNTLKSQVIDLKTLEEYVLVDVKDATGGYIAKINEEYENIIDDIVNTCTKISVFKSSQAKEIITYLKEKYDVDLEYLWEKYPDNAAFRNKLNNKWFGIILTVLENKLGMDGDKQLEIIDLKYPKDKINEIVDNVSIFPGYHMNKKSWITVILDDRVQTKEIFKLIDISYELSLR